MLHKGPVHDHANPFANWIVRYSWPAVLSTPFLTPWSMPVSTCPAEWAVDEDEGDEDDEEEYE
eukprot:500097-Pyramimonas_sp.AAC.1